MTTITEARHKIASRAEWLVARIELLKEEKELTRRSDELARRRQALPWVRIEKEYRFDTDEGSASLADLFGGRSQLLIYHLMFGPDFQAACKTCSTIADGFNGFAVHLANHDVMLGAVSANAALNPHTAPIPVIASACRTNIPVTPRMGAPSASRIPISRDRCATE